MKLFLIMQYMSLEIQIVSDLHLEFWANKPKFDFVRPTAPILALLGDTCCMGSDEDFDIFKRFINEILPMYQIILIITGNHEYYYSNKTPPTQANTFDAVDAKLRKYCKTTSVKLHFLNNSSLKIIKNKKLYTVVGSTWWSHIPDTQQARIERVMSDYQYIYTGNKPRLIKAAEISKLHANNVAFLKRQITRAKKDKSKLIVLTHHKPYITDYNPDSYDPAYMSDDAALINSPVVFWGYGHTHIKDDTVINGVRVVSNPRGYPGQKTKYDKYFKVAV